MLGIEPQNKPTTRVEVPKGHLPFLFFLFFLILYDKFMVKMMVALSSSRPFC